MHTIRRSFTLILLVSVLSFENVFQRNQAAGNGIVSSYLPLTLREEIRLYLMGPEGGSIVVMAINPNNPNILYAGTWGSGMYKSIDGGLSWQITNQGLWALDINSLAIDPWNPAILYAGTYDHGVFKSTDSGSTWQQTGPGLSEYPIVYTIAVNPINPNVVYVGTRNHQTGPPWGGGVYITTNGGGSWVKSNEGLGEEWVYDIKIDPVTPGTVYAATHSQGVYKSTSGGAYWVAVNSGITDLSTRSLVIDPTNPETLYVGTWHYEGVYKTTDGGDTWESARTGLNHKIYSLNIDPVNPNIIYAATYRMGIMVTEDGATTWHSAGLYPDMVYNVMIDPKNDSTIYAGTLGDGFYKSTNRGGNWVASNTGMKATSITSIAANWTTTVTNTVSQQNKGLDAVYTSIYGAGIFKTTDLGQTWTRINNGLGETWVYSLAISPASPLTLYAGTESTGFFSTIDGGATWIASNNGLPAPLSSEFAFDALADPYLRSDLFDRFFFEGVPDQTNSDDAVAAMVPILAIAVDSFNPQMLYIGTQGRGIFRSPDGGGNWYATNLTNHVVYTILSDPFTTSILYAGCDSASNTMYRSLNGGESWTISNTGMADLTIYALAADPFTPGILYAGTSAGVYKSVDSGENWAAFSLPGQIVYALGLSRATPSMIYAGTKTGLYISYDHGSTWKPMYNDLMNQEITYLALDIAGSPQIDLIGTRGSGVYWNEINFPTPK